MSNCGNADKKTKYGVVTIRNPGRAQAPPNLQTLRRPKSAGYTKSAGDVTLQGPALRAFKAAEQRITPKRLRQKGKTRPIILTGNGYRSYGLQASLYNSDRSGRYADPDCSLHCEALAVDVHTGFLGALIGRRARKALIAEGFVFGVDGEPWHASFGFVG